MIISLFLVKREKAYGSIIKKNMICAMKNVFKKIGDCAMFANVFSIEVFEFQKIHHL